MSFRSCATLGALLVASSMAAESKTVKMAVNKKPLTLEGVRAGVLQV